MTARRAARKLGSSGAGNPASCGGGLRRVIMDSRTLLTGGGTLLVAATLPRDANARSKAAELMPDDSHFMQLAIDQAQEADFPFGAVIVEGKRVLALGRNSSKPTADPT